MAIWLLASCSRWQAADPGAAMRSLSGVDGTSQETTALSVCLTQLARDGGAESLLQTVARIDARGGVLWNAPLAVGTQNLVIGSDGDIYVSTMQEPSSGGEEMSWVPPAGGFVPTDHALERFPPP